MKVRQAEWAALCPWRGLQGKPTWLEDPTGIPISGVIGLQEILDGLEPDAGGAVHWSEIEGKPTFGSAAFVSTSTLQPAWRATTLQVGAVPVEIGVQDYPVVFTETMADDPMIQLQHFLDGTGEMFYASVILGSVTPTGFTFRLNAVPSESFGEVQYEAKVQSQP